MHDADELLPPARGRRRDSWPSSQDDLDRRRASLHRYLRGAVDDRRRPDRRRRPRVGRIDPEVAVARRSPRSGSPAPSAGSTWRRTRAPSSTSRATNRNEGFVANLGSPEGFEPVFRNLEVIEQSCLERTGSVLGYDDDGERAALPRRHRRRSSGTPSHGSRTACARSSHEWAAHEPAPGAPSSATSPTCGGWPLARSCSASAPTRPARRSSSSARWRHDDNKGTRSVEQMIPASSRSAAPATPCSPVPWRWTSCCGRRR